MSVVIVLEGVGPDRFTVAVSPLAELAATLHVLTEHTHHPKHAAWAAEVTGTAPPEFKAGLDRFTPLWTPLRWRAFYPGIDTKLSGPPASGLTSTEAPATKEPGVSARRREDAGNRPANAERSEAMSLTLDRFAELTAYTCASRYHGFDFSRLLHEPRQAAALRQAVARLPEPHVRLTEDLLRDPEALRTDVLEFLALCRQVFFGDLWARTAPTLTHVAHRLRQQLATEGPAAALGSLSPATLRQHPARIVFDKVHDAVISPARTPVLLIPTWHGAPHVLVKNEPGLPPVVHFPVEAPSVGVTLARARLLALTNPHRVRLCRLIARQAMTTADLADRLSMTRPMVARHLRVLRELGLVCVERNGRYVHYGLDLVAVERIGHDVVMALQR